MYIFFPQWVWKKGKYIEKYKFYCCGKNKKIKCKYEEKNN